jgi:transcriptional regulator with XRE-family HTH domain
MFSTKKAININILLYLCNRINIKKYMDIKTIIETKIKDANLTKKEVAERMGIIPNNINAMLANPSWPTLEKLSGALGIPVSELVADNPASHIEPQTHCPYCGHDLNIKVE